jgi:hypothetical protein
LKKYEYSSVSRTSIERLEAGGWRLEAGGWRLEAGGWRLEAGGWRLEDECWRLEAVYGCNVKK